jgi:hypothetical protein
MKMKKTIFALALVFGLAGAAQAAPAYSACNSSGHVGEIRFVNETRIDFIMYDLPGHGSQVLTINSANVGNAEGIKMLLSMLQNASATGKEIWAGSIDANGSVAGCQESWNIGALTQY